MWALLEPQQSMELFGGKMMLLKWSEILRASVPEGHLGCQSVPRAGILCYYYQRSETLAGQEMSLYKALEHEKHITRPETYQFSTGLKAQTLDIVYPD